MKRMGLLFLAFIFNFTGIYGKEKASIIVLSGYTTSAYEDQPGAKGAIPFGLQIGYMVFPNIQVGFEVNHLLNGLTWEKRSLYYLRQSTYSQTIHSVYVKAYEGHGKVKLFYKGGFGYFMGDYKITYKYDGEEETYAYFYPIESGIGFTLGVGLNVNKIFLEFDYNIVSRVYGRRADTLEGSSSVRKADDKVGMNTWSVLIGYKFNL